MAEAAADPSSAARSRNGSIVPVTTSPGDFSALHTRPTVSDLHGENHYAQVARKNWLNTKKAPKVRQNVLKEELWDPLEKEDFAFGSLLILENLQLVEL
jgi:intron-binding protein aquarius